MEERIVYKPEVYVVTRNEHPHVYLGNISQPVIYGAQGTLRDYLGKQDQTAQASALDHLVASVTTCMYDTLKAALEARAIRYNQAGMFAQAQGTVVERRKVLRLTAIHILYEIEVSSEFHIATERALRVHPRACPVHQSIGDSIHVSWEARLLSDGVVSHLREDASAL